MFRDFFIEAGLYIVAARPEMGKSALAANIMKEQLSADEKQGAMYVHTKEMSERLEGFLEQEERIKIVDGTALSTEIIFLEARWMKADYGLKMVVIDDIYNLLKNQSYMHIEPSKKERVTYLFTRFKSMAEAYDIPVIIVMDVKEIASYRQNHRPKFSDLRHKKLVKEYCEKVILLYRDEFYNRETDLKNIAEIKTYDLKREIKEEKHFIWLPQYLKFKKIE